MIKKNPLKYLKPVFIIVLILFAGVITAFFVINSVDYVEAGGEIKPLEYQIISPKVSGIIKKCYFKDGESVKKGSLVLETDAKEYELESAELADKGELLSLKAKALEDNLSLYNKEKKLFMNKMERDLKELSIKKENDIISRGEYEEEIYKRQSEEFSRNEKLLLAENEMKQLRKEISSIGTEMESVRDKIGKCRVLAQIDGIIVDEDSKIKDGVFYNSGEAIQEIFADREVYAEVYITEKKVIKVEPGQRVKLFVDAVPFTRYRTFNGRLVSLKETKTQNSAAGYIGRVLIEDPFYELRNINDIKTKRLFFGLKLKARIYTGKRSFLDFFRL